MTKVYYQTHDQGKLHINIKENLSLVPQDVSLKSVNGNYIVKALYVEEKESISKEQPLFGLDAEPLVELMIKKQNEINSLQIVYENSKNENRRLIQDVTSSIGAYTISISFLTEKLNSLENNRFSEQRDSSEYEIQFGLEDIAYRKNELRRIQVLFKSGDLPGIEYETAQKELSDVENKQVLLELKMQNQKIDKEKEKAEVKNQKDEVKSQIELNKNNLQAANEKLRLYKQNEIVLQNKYSLELAALQDELKKLEQEKTKVETVLSDTDGIIKKIHIYEGDTTKPQSPLIEVILHSRFESNFVIQKDFIHLFTIGEELECKILGRQSFTMYAKIMGFEEAASDPAHTLVKLELHDTRLTGDEISQIEFKRSTEIYFYWSKGRFEYCCAKRHFI